MKIIKFYAYIFFRLKKYYELWQALISFVAIIAFNLLSLIFLYSSLTHSDDYELFFLQQNDYFQQRFYILIVDLVPLTLILYIIYRITNKKVEAYFKEFEEESEVIKKKRNRGRILYFVFTIVFFIFSIVSSSFF